MNTAVRTKEQFNMEDFGFEVCEASSGRKPYTQGKDYIIKSVNKGADKNYYIPIISLCEETTDFVIGLLGETVDVGINSKGYICIKPGTKRKVSLVNGGSRGKINIGGMRDKIDSIYGEYKRIYVTVHPFGNFNAVIIKPTGEKDEK